MCEQDLLHVTVEAIRQFYAERGAKYGLTAGWSFLYSPRKTFSSKTPLILTGLNPGGTEVTNAESITFEGGNAYFDEKWGSNGQPNTLQKQIRTMYDEVVKISSPQITRLDLIKNTLAANYVPYRSPKWKSLNDESGIIEFSRRIWKSILAKLNPKVIICFGGIPYKEFRTLFIQAGYHESKLEKESMNWGKITVEVSDITRHERTLLLVRVPHLSRYKLFNRSESSKAAQLVCSRVAEALSGHIQTGK